MCQSNDLAHWSKAVSFGGEIQAELAGERSIE